MGKAKIAILISGTGTNMAALLYAAKHADAPYEIVLVASNNPDAEGLRLAAAEGMRLAINDLAQAPVWEPGAVRA